MISKIGILFVIMTITSASSHAQDLISGSPEKNNPIEITAQHSLEWHRNDAQYIAKGKVIAKQGQTAIYSELLTADYKDNEKGKVDIWRLTAATDVKIESKGTTAYGDRLVYDVDNSVSIMTGKNLKLVSKNQIITAEDSLEYWINDGIFIAKGNAIARREDDTIKANTIKAYFTEDKNGKRIIKNIEANDSVIITTPEEIVTGDKAEYLAIDNKAILTGNVKIIRDKNTLEGTRAEIDLNSNISKIFGSTKKNGRVRGVFYPSNSKK